MPVTGLPAPPSVGISVLLIQHDGVQNSLVGSRSPPLSQIPPPSPTYQLHEPWAVALRARAQAGYRPEGPTNVGAQAWGHRPALKRFSGEIGDFDLSAFRAAEVQGYMPYEPEELSEAESQDSQESLSGYVQSRWDDTKTERRYAYGMDASVKFSGVRRMEWNRPEWKDGLLKTNHLGSRTPVEKMKAAVFKVMAMNRVYKGITAPPAEWQFEVERQKAGRLAEEVRLIKAEKERVRKEKMKSRQGRKDARATARGQRQALIEKQLMQQNTQAQNLVEDMEEALLKVPELQPPAVPDLHPQELFEAKLVLHDLATSGLGQKVSEFGGATTHSVREPPPPRKVQNWDQAAISNWLNEAHHYAEGLSPSAARRFYPEPQKGLLLQPVYPLHDLPKQPWYPASDILTERTRTHEAEPEPEAVQAKDRVWL
ncbi:unnamed protein product [Symbiodinium natans]|uniref:Uncharacterized protein n=1 Tax=Symbiodinium natans TaxID=878477 RepID=A0A812I4R6_9DINO|nr:unnamed protein product [Symbiodinium natans]